MHKQQPDSTKKRSIVRKIFRVFLFLLLGIIGLVVLLLIAVQIPYVQNIARGKAQTWLQHKLQTKVQIGHINIGFPKTIELRNVYLEDRQHDTLFAGKTIGVNLDMWKLFHSDILIRSVALEELTVKIKRQLPDTSFNFQFIADAFTGAADSTKAKDSTGNTSFSLHAVNLKKIRLVYNDIVTGNDVVIWIEQSNIKADSTDLHNMRFVLPQFTLKGVTARIYQQKPLQTPYEHPATPTANPAFRLAVANISLEDIDLDYRNDVSRLHSNVQLGSLDAGLKEFDLAKQNIHFDKLSLSNTKTIVEIGKQETAEVLSKKAQPIADSASAGWQLNLASLGLHNNTIRFDNAGQPKLANGMDYAHLAISQLNLDAEALHYTNDSLSGRINNGSFDEQSGFVLKTLQTSFAYTDRGAYLRDLLLQTPHTTLQKSLQLSYPSITALQNNPALMQIDADLPNCQVQVKDILSFAPFLAKQPLLSNPEDVFHINARLRGSLAKIDLPVVQVSGLRNTRAAISGQLQHLDQPKRLYADLHIRELRSGKLDLERMLPKNTLPPNIRLPESISVNGRFRGGKDDAITALQVSSSAGNLAIEGRLQHISDKQQAVYDASIVLDQFDLGKIIPDTAGTLGVVSGRINAKGKGYDPASANSTVHALISRATIKRYPYQNIRLDASLQQQQLLAKGSIRDPNVSLSFDADGKMKGRFPALTANLEVDTLQTLPLHLSSDSIFYRGRLTADFADTQPDSLDGSLLLTNSLLLKGNKKIPLDTLQILAGQNDSGRYIRLQSDFAKLALSGTYTLTEMGSLFRQVMEPYFSTVEDSVIVQTKPYDFRIDGTLQDAPVLKAFLPQLDTLKPVTLQSHFTSDQGWKATLDAPLIVQGSNRIYGLSIQTDGDQEALKMEAVTNHIQSGSSLNVYATRLDASISDNKIVFDLLNKDKAGKNKYRIGGLLQQPAKGNYALSLRSDSLMLNYDRWQVADSNQILVGKNLLHIRQFVLSNKDQSLGINSASQAPEAPVDISIQNFRLSTLSAFIKQDTLFADGTLNGKAQVTDVFKTPAFTADLVVKNLAMSADTLGDLQVKVDKKDVDALAADVRLTGRGNDVQLAGTYYTKPVNNNSFEIAAHIRQLSLNTLRGASNQFITDATGSLNGELELSGSMQTPKLSGDINFNKTRFNLGPLNSYFAIDQEKISFSQEGIAFNDFTIVDSAGNKATIDGIARSSDFRHFNFDITARARDFHALNTTKRQNKLYHGQLYFSTNLRVRGTETAPLIDGNLTINDKTRLTVVIPQRDPGIEEREGIVKFVSADSPPLDFVLLNQYDSVNRSAATGMDVSVNITVQKEAELSLLIDEGNGDLLNVRGEASLNAGVDPSGKITLSGTYELESGSYQLTFNFIKRKFDIQKGSKITWKGEPTSADIDLRAIYIANAAPLDLVRDQLDGTTGAARNTYLQKLPFEVDLKMKGELLQPLITFDILLPDNKNYNVSKNIVELVNEKLTDLRKEPSELNKQVFALLLLTRFVNENPFQSSGGGMTAESFARASVSKLLTEQLNQLATDLVRGVDINFDVVSQNDDYSTGTRQSKTDLNVALSKRLLNDRLTVTVGSNFELEGVQNSGQQTSNIAGNVAVDYQLSKDGRYLLRAYRKNDYQGVIEGYIVETGVGFIISVDYNKFREIFQSQKKRAELRRQAREKEKAAQKNKQP